MLSTCPWPQPPNNLYPAPHELPINQLCKPAPAGTPRSTVVTTDWNHLFNFGFCRGLAKTLVFNQLTSSKKSKKRLHTWCHDYRCLLSTRAMKPPSSLEVWGGSSSCCSKSMVAKSCTQISSKHFQVYVRVQVTSWYVFPSPDRGLCMWFHHPPMANCTL